MYQVHTIRKGSDRYYTICVKKNMTKDEAFALKEKRMANPTRVCDFVVVADSKVELFFERVAKASAPLVARAKAIEERQNKRWKELDEMYKKGYRVTDAIAYIHS